MSSGPIFVREKAKMAILDINEVPNMLRETQSLLKTKKL